MENNYFIALGSTKDDLSAYNYNMQCMNHIYFIDKIDGMELCNVEVPFKDGVKVIPIIIDSEINGYSLSRNDKEYETRKDFDNDVIYVHKLQASNVPQLSVEVPSQDEEKSFNVIVVVKKDDLGAYSVKNVMQIETEHLDKSKSLNITIDIFNDSEVVTTEDK